MHKSFLLSEGFFFLIWKIYLGKLCNLEFSPQDYIIVHTFPVFFFYVGNFQKNLLQNGRERIFKITK